MASTSQQLEAELSVKNERLGYHHEQLGRIDSRVAFLMDSKQSLEPWSIEALQRQRTDAYNYVLTTLESFRAVHSLIFQGCPHREHLQNDHNESARIRFAQSLSNAMETDRYAFTRVLNSAPAKMPAINEELSMLMIQRANQEAWIARVSADIEELENCLRGTE